MEQVDYTTVKWKDLEMTRWEKEISQIRKVKDTIRGPSSVTGVGLKGKEDSKGTTKAPPLGLPSNPAPIVKASTKIGRASCRERV